MPGAAQQLRQAPLPPGASVKDKQARHELYLRLLRATAASLLHFTASGDGDPSPLGGEGICCHRHGRGNCCQRQICRGAAASSSQRRPAGSPRALAVRSAPRPHATPPSRVPARVCAPCRAAAERGRRGGGCGGAGRGGEDSWR